MAQVIAILLFIIFLCLSGIHFYWGLGGKWGGNAALPAKPNNELLFQPGLIACFIVALGLLSFGLLILNKVALITLPLPLWLYKYGIFGLSAIFAFRTIGDFKYIGFTRRVNNTLFAQMDRKYYTPLCLTLTVLILLLELLY